MRHFLTMLANKNKLFNLLVISSLLVLMGCEKDLGKDPCLDAIASSVSNESSSNTSPSVTSTQPQSKEHMMIILDASGSMSYPEAENNKKTKIDVAKEAIIDIINHQKILDLYDISFVAFGHLNDGCEKNLQPFQEKNQDIISAMKKIVPKGETPLAKTIKEIGNDLKKRNKQERWTIILLSDGKDTCEEDEEDKINEPINEVKNLKKQGFSFLAVNVISYNIVEKQVDEMLRKLAEEGDGKFIKANNENQLNDALKELTLGVGRIRLEKAVLENKKEIKGWKLYEKTGELIEPIKDEKKSEKSDENLYFEQNVLSGNYYFCIMFSDNSIKLSNVTIEKDKLTKIDPRD